jgi:60 kDa SS-A/Ro ribonucleoprotein
VIPAIAAVLKYVVRGLKDAKKEFGDKPEAQQVLTYLQTVEDFKRCDDEHHASRLIEMHSLSLEHIPAHFLKSKQVRKTHCSHLNAVLV